MSALDALLPSVLKKVTPTPREEREIRETLAEVVQAVEAVTGGLDYTVAGSYTRGTWMTDKKEFDIFLLFPESTSRETLEKKGLAFGAGVARRLGGSWTIAYAEHPYTRASYRGFLIDIVPAYKIADPAHLKSAVDRTPFHNRYLAEHFPPTLAPQVRLLKQFLKANGLYGSDTATLGFSGYLCELLMVNYRSFTALLRAAAAWEPGTVVDLANHAKAAFPGQPLVVIDPVDPKRNVAAVLSLVNFVRFSDLCRQFLKAPRRSFFFPPPFRADHAGLGRRLATRGTAMLGVRFARPKEIDDVLYPQLRRTAARLANILREKEFLVMGQEVFASPRDCLLLFEMETWSLPAVRKVVGPPVAVKKHAGQFLQKYRTARLWVEGDRWTAEIPRQFPLAADALRHVLRRPHLLELGVAPVVAQALPKGFSLLTGPALVQKAADPALARFLHDYLERRIRLPLPAGSRPR
ncbi:MAG: CCA tRNA nucleotidyltransferase [Candidatus Aenigmarchaeota archaeon]|nr:CCA tRNA nucleotidyltransferase [Candidatus Aenigmarchaeota archaeon]